MSAILSPLPLLAFAFAVTLVIVSSLFLLASKSLSYPQLIIQKDNMVGWLITYVANYAPYLLALVLMLWPLRNFAIEHTDARFCCPEIPRILAGCLVASAVALILGHGFYDDWGMRVTLPLSIGLAAAVTQVLFSGLKWPYMAALLVVLAVSSASSLSEFARSVLVPTNCKSYGSFRIEDMGALASQYEGRRDSLLYRYFVRSY